MSLTHNRAPFQIAEIRTGKLVDGKDIELKAGEEIILTNDYTVKGTPGKICHSYELMSDTVREGSQVLIDDGLISLTVVKVISKTEILCRIDNGGELGETKGVNLPGANVQLPALTDKDKADLKFGCEQKVDLVAASFIRKAQDVIDIRKFLEAHGGVGIKIISKIENQEGLINFDEILEVSDGIMVARGDLGVEIPSESVAIAQKMMISKCNLVGKPVVTATQMLDSMIRNPRPTRAEMTDVANAVVDGTDCVMLSGETAKGSYPVETVETMVQIVGAAERMFDSEGRYKAIVDAVKESEKRISVAETIASSGVKTGFDIGCKLILCLTQSGSTARLVTKYRPEAPVICVTSDQSVARQLLVHTGAFPVVVNDRTNNMASITSTLTMCMKAGMCTEDDFICVIEGMREGEVGGTSVMRVIKMGSQS